MGKYMRPLWFGGRAPAFDPETQSWADYATAIKPLTADVAADTCLVTPSIWGYELGTLAGRLCNAAVTVADSPMRVTLLPGRSEGSGQNARSTSTGGGWT